MKYARNILIGSAFVCAAGVLSTTSGPCRSQASATVEFLNSGNAVQIAAKFLDNLVFFPVRVNESRPSLFELDSAAAASSMDPHLASELNLTDVNNPTLNLDGLNFLLPNLPLAAKENFSEQIGRPYEGTLGKDLLDAVVVYLDYARQTAQIYDPNSFHYSGQGKELDFQFQGALPVVRAKFGFRSKAFEGDFAIDTGLDAAVLISQKYADAHRILSSHVHRESTPDQLLGEGTFSARLEGFQLGPYVADGAIAEIGDLPFGKQGQGLAGAIGSKMLRRYTVIFDYPHRQLILEPNKTFPDDDPGDMSGLSLIATGSGLKTFTVVAVQPGTPAADARIRKGDVITGIDSEPAADLSLMDIRALFQQVGHSYKLLIERDGQEMSVSIQMRRLL